MRLACLESGLDPKEPLENPGYFQLGNRRIKDLAQPGFYDFNRALKLSSNTYFIHHGLRRLNKIVEIGEQFHLGESCGIPTRQDSAGLFPTEQYRRNMPRDQHRAWTDGFTANLCIGQGEITVTPMQMAVMTAAVANGARCFGPDLFNELRVPRRTGLPRRWTSSRPACAMSWE